MPALQAVPKPEVNLRRRSLIGPSKNGRFYVVLMAGGTEAHVRELRDYLMQDRGILVQYHWDYEKPNQFDHPIPVDVDFVIGLKTIASHNLTNKLRSICKRQGVPRIITSHKKATMFGALYAAGICKADPLPLNVQSVAFLRNVPNSVVTPPELVAKAEEVKHLGPHVSIHLQQLATATPMPSPQFGSPSVELCVLAGALFGMCRDQKVSLMITPTEMSFQPLLLPPAAVGV